MGLTHNEQILSATLTNFCSVFLDGDDDQRAKKKKKKKKTKKNLQWPKKLIVDHGWLAGLVSF
ncbi:unnamed protein product [Citrullus colocynthis]|uniref:Uncharacterized protein n=1 Tax=Citrullus colocynthis TaxID=252529 RepID=A0ABP0Y241_9ROSI